MPKIAEQSACRRCPAHSTTGQDGPTMVDVNKPNALGELVDAVCRANGWARNDVIRRAENRGIKLTKSNLGRLCSGTLPSIKGARVIDLADALGVSSSRVALAAVRSMGFAVGDESLTTAEVIESDPSLSADTKGALLAVLHSARRSA